MTEHGDTKAAPPEAAVARTATRTPRGLARYLSLDDFERVARRRLPRMIHGYVAGAVETGAGLRFSREGYDALALRPRVLVDVSDRSIATELFGKRYAAPFGVAPVGGSAMIAYRGDLALAEAARAANVPMVMSASSLIKLEEVKAANPDAWFQAYLAGDLARIEPMIDRVAAAGYETLVLTVDTPMLGNRENNTRNGFSMPLKITPRVVLDSALHPWWSLGVIVRTFVNHGMPRFENMEAQQGPPMFSQNFARNFGARDRLCWDHARAIRRRWKGRFVIKGILSPEDARIARDIGCDGIIVSNHGGRQLDYAVAPIRALPGIVDVAGDMPVMIDGGIRRGTDVIKALALGAKFVFLGRPMIFAAFLGGAAGVGHAMRLLYEEIDRDMAMLGINRLDELTPETVLRAT